MWLGLLGFVLAGWSILDGANLGLGMSLRRFGQTGTERRLLLTAIGPFLLGGEVWLVAGAGLLIGAFPALEKDLLFAYYPLVVVLVLAWVLRDMGVWFRSRRVSVRWRSGWEWIVVAASTAQTFAWGMLLGNVVQGVPTGGRAGLATLFGPYSLLWGAMVVSVFTLHGAVFGILRLPAGQRPRPAHAAQRSGLMAFVLLGAVVAATPALGVELVTPLAALAIGVLAAAAVVSAIRLTVTGRDSWAFVCTCMAALAPVVAVGVAAAPRLLDGVAADTSLRLLGVIALPAVPVLIAVQVWMWWVFRHRVDERSAVFF